LSVGLAVPDCALLAVLSPAGALVAGLGSGALGEAQPARVNVIDTANAASCVFIMLLTSWSFHHAKSAQSPGNTGNMSYVDNCRKTGKQKQGRSMTGPAFL